MSLCVIVSGEKTQPPMSLVYLYPSAGKDHAPEIDLHGSILDKSSCDTGSRCVSQDVEILLRKSQTLIDRYDHRSEASSDENAIPGVFTNALHLAVDYSAADVVRLLLRYGVEPNRGACVLSVDAGASRPLHQLALAALLPQGFPEGVAKGVPEGVPEGLSQGVAQRLPEGLPPRLAALLAPLWLPQVLLFAPVVAPGRMRPGGLPRPVAQGRLAAALRPAARALLRPRGAPAAAGLPPADAAAGHQQGRGPARRRRRRRAQQSARGEARAVQDRSGGEWHHGVRGRDDGGGGGGGPVTSPGKKDSRLDFHLDVRTDGKIDNNKKQLYFTKSAKNGANSSEDRSRLVLSSDGPREGGGNGGGAAGGAAGGGGAQDRSKKESRSPGALESKSIIKDDSKKDVLREREKDKDEKMKETRKDVSTRRVSWVPGVTDNAAATRDKPAYKRRHSSVVKSSEVTFQRQRSFSLDSQQQVRLSMPGSASWLVVPRPVISTENSTTRLAEPRGERDRSEPRYFTFSDIHPCTWDANPAHAASQGGLARGPASARPGAPHSAGAGGRTPPARGCWS
nr:uncharacterized protein LOC113825081 [Penaeus vannamei]